MPRRRSSTRRSAIEWSVRGLLAAVAALAGYFSVTNSLGYAVKASPELAHTLTPRDGRITARLSQKVLTAGATEANRDRAEQLARLALRQDPTAVKAVAVLGLTSQLKGDLPRARRLFAYADALSRRELQTQLWAIEDAVGRNDIPGALRQYDVALRTSRTAPELLFPVLASASSDPAIGSALVKVLAANPAWSGSFVDHLVGKGPDPRATSRLLRRLQRAGLPISDSAQATAIRALRSGGFLDDAWAHYATVRAGANRRMSRDPRFTLAITEPTLFDWAPIQDDGVSTSIQSGDQGGIFDFATSPGVGGPVLQQIQMLPPGKFRLEGHSMGVDQPASSRPYWVLTCDNGQELGRVDVPNSTQDGGMFGGQFIVPAECGVQTLLLVARSSDSLAGVTGQIDRVQLQSER